MPDFILPLLGPIIKMAFKTLFNSLLAHDPIMGKTVLASLYPPIDGIAQKYADASPGQWDNVVVDAAMASMEEVAKDNGLVLSDVDGDSTPTV
jgi:hypothetical protein